MSPPGPLSSTHMPLRQKKPPPKKKLSRGVHGAGSRIAGQELPGSIGGFWFTNGALGGGHCTYCFGLRHPEPRRHGLLMMGTSASI